MASIRLERLPSGSANCSAWSWLDSIKVCVGASPIAGRASSGKPEPTRRGPMKASVPLRGPTRLAPNQNIENNPMQSSKGSLAWMLYPRNFDPLVTFLHPKHGLIYLIFNNYFVAERRTCPTWLERSEREDGSGSKPACPPKRRRIYAMLTSVNGKSFPLQSSGASIVFASA
jgi:hypothetical protein